MPKISKTLGSSALKKPRVTKTGRVVKTGPGRITKTRAPAMPIRSAKSTKSAPPKPLVQTKPQAQVEQMVSLPTGPEGLKNMSVLELQALVGYLTTPAWEESVGALPDELQVDAIILRETAQACRLQFETAELALISGKLLELEPELNEGKKQLDEAMVNFKNVEDVLENADAFIRIFERILANEPSAV